VFNPQDVWTIYPVTARMGVIEEASGAQHLASTSGELLV